MELFLVRHGESADNVERRIQGWRGGKLTDRGRAEARAAGQALLTRGLLALYTSDLSRAAETAGIMGTELGLAPVREAAFREIRLGPWEGRLVADVEANDGETLRAWREDGSLPPYDDIEPIGVFRDRLVEGLETVSARHHGPVAVVSHGGALSVILSHFMGLDVRRIWQMPVENGSVSRLVRSGGSFRVVSWNETLHLPPRGGAGFNALG